MAKPQTIRLRAFRIENNDINDKVSPLLDILGTKLDKSTSANDRRIQLNPNDPDEESDLIADFDTARKDQCIFGTMMRIVPAGAMPSLPDSVFQQPKIRYEALSRLALTDKFIYRSHFYFALDHEHLVVTLPSNRTITAFQTYINHYLSPERQDRLFEFTPVICNTPQASMDNIKSIRFKDSQIDVAAAATATIKTRMMKVKEDALRFIFGDSPELQKILDQGIVSAELLIKFASTRNKPKDVQELLAPIIKPMSDTDNIEIKTKSGETLKGSTMQQTADVEVELTESGMISEKGLFFGMEQFLAQLRKK